MKQKISEPTLEDERLLNSVVENKSDEVEITGTGKKYKIGWMRGFTRRKITDVMLEEGDDEKSYCKVAAAIVLNDYWKLKLVWPLLWRWMYYVKQYSEEQLLPVLTMGQKKTPQETYYLATILATGMKDTMMTMTKKEVSRFLQEKNSGKATTSEKSTLG